MYIYLKEEYKGGVPKYFNVVNVPLFKSMSTRICFCLLLVLILIGQFDLEVGVDLLVTVVLSAAGLWLRHANKL